MKDVLLYSVVAIALAFDFVNGFHDAANSIATVVSTRVLPPRIAVAWAAVFNFVAFLVFGVHVAQTIGKGVVDPAVVTPALVLAAVLGALLWNLLTWYVGLPTSSSHALIGGLAGAAIALAGPRAVLAPGLIKIVIFIVLAPLIGLVGGMVIMWIVMWLAHRATPARIEGVFRRLQLVSAAAYSLGHGGNDAQKTMGIIMALLVAKGYLASTAEVPWWVVVTCSLAMGLGTLSGGWRIVRTMGMRLTKLKPFGGFCAETGAASMLFVASALGVPVSTTHTITGGIVGVGLVNNPAGVRWGVALRIVWAWVFTIQSAAIVAAAVYALLRAVKL
ncbi:MAG TPA: inorganic phosphate transporter [Polyangia bacterium]